MKLKLTFHRSIYRCFWMTGVLLILIGSPSRAANAAICQQSTEWIKNLYFLNKSKILASSWNGNEIILWNINNGAIEKRFSIPKTQMSDSIRQIITSPDDNYLFAAYKPLISGIPHWAIAVWNIQTGKLIETRISNIAIFDFKSMQISPNGQYFLVTDMLGTYIYAHEMGWLPELFFAPGPSGEISPKHGRFSADSQTILTEQLGDGTDINRLERNISLWDIKTKRRIARFAPATDGEFRASGSLVTVDAREDNAVVTLWSARTFAKQRAYTFGNILNAEDPVRIAPDGNHVLLQLKNQDWQLIETGTGKAISILAGDTIKFTPDSKWIVTILYYSDHSKY